MGIDELDVLKSIYDNTFKFKEDEYKIIKENLDRIEVIDAFLLSVKDEMDIKIFSPRREEDIYREKIIQYEQEKSNLKKLNQRHYEKINLLNNQIQQLDKLINSVDENRNKSKIYDILDMQEKERQRIANDLHDSTIQNLTHLIHTIELGSIYIEKDIIQAKLELETSIKNLKLIIDEMRQIIFNLRPMSFDDLGFKHCIDNFIYNMRRQYVNFQIEYDVCDLEKKDFCIEDDSSVNLFIVTIYRLIQESVMNAIKHSKGKKIILLIEKKKNRCVIHIKDDGEGYNFDDDEKSNNHFGLVIMKERISLLNGKVSINTDENGTEVIIEIPLINWEEN